MIMGATQTKVMNISCVPVPFHVVINMEIEV